MSYLMRCPACGKKNRVPDDKEGKSGHCGSCRQTLPPLYYQPQQVTEGSFDTFVRDYPGPVLAEFWAPW